MVRERENEINLDVRDGEVVFAEYWEDTVKGALARLAEVKARNKDLKSAAYFMRRGLLCLMEYLGDDEVDHEKHNEAARKIIDILKW